MAFYLRTPLDLEYISHIHMETETHFLLTFFLAIPFNHLLPLYPLSQILANLLQMHQKPKCVQMCLFWIFKTTQLTTIISPACALPHHSWHFSDDTATAPPLQINRSITDTQSPLSHLNPSITLTPYQVQNTHMTLKWEGYGYTKVHTQFERNWRRFLKCILFNW